MKYCSCDNKFLVWKNPMREKLNQLNKWKVKSYLTGAILCIESLGNGRFVCNRCRNRVKASDLSFSNKIGFFGAKLPALAFLMIFLKGPFFTVYPDNIGPAILGALLVLAPIYFFKPLRDEYEYPTPPQKE